MIRFLLPREGRFYRANLHSHSTDSDGVFSPEELVEEYRRAGYSVLAITDHMVMRDRSALCREDFLVLNGFEYHHAPMTSRGRIIHLGMIAADPTITEMPMLESFPPAPEGVPSPEFDAKINEMIRRGNEAGFLTVYNHMRWSHDTDADALAYEGLFGMEIFNFFSEILGIEEYNLSTFLTKLRSGQRLFGIMADDNHNVDALPTLGLASVDPLACSFGGFVEIKASALTYPAIIAALREGSFYGSMGPTFEALYLEDGVLHVKCSPVRNIAVMSANRCGHDPGYGGIHTDAAIRLHGDEEFIVVVLTDEAGRRAVSQPYWL